MLQANNDSPKEGTEQGQQKETQRPTFATKLLLGYLYFSQGMITSFPGNIIYLYEQIPEYYILSLLSFGTLPASFKFLMAPLLEKYSLISYGKRKFWIVISQFVMALSLFAASFYLQMRQAYIIAIINFIIFLAYSFQDISLDALSLKELKNPKLMSVIQVSCQSLGAIIGNLLIFKLTSVQFGLSIGLKTSIISLRTYLLLICLIIIGILILIHIRFHETYVEADIRSSKQSFIKVVSIYKYFFKLEYRYCRFLIFQLLYYQGFNLLMAGFTNELIKKGISKNFINTIDTIQSMFNTLLGFFLGTKLLKTGYKNGYILQLSLTWILLVYYLTFQPIALTPIIILMFISGLLGQWDFLLNSSLAGQMPETGANGMLYTMSASGVNLGKNTSLHSLIIQKMGWEATSKFGICTELVLIIFLTPKMMNLIHEGKTEIEQLEQQNDKTKDFELNEDYGCEGYEQKIDQA